MSHHPVDRLRRAPSSRLCAAGSLLAAVLLSLAGCAGGGRAGLRPPGRVPSGDVAVVGVASITIASFDHWRPIVARGLLRSGTAAVRSRRASERTVSFLIKAQWLSQESRAEGANEATLTELVARRTANAQPHDGMTRPDVAFQARLDAITEALQSRHRDAQVSMSAAQIAAYYVRHRSQFKTPAVRDTLLVVTHDRAGAMRARSELSSKKPWAAVAKRWSVDSSALNGGADAVVEGVQSPALVRAVFAARPGVLSGPVKARLAAEPSTTDYYVFEVTGSHGSSRESLGQVATEIRQKLTEEARERGLAAFVGAYELRWRRMTLCAPDYLVPECRNYSASTP